MRPVQHDDLLKFKFLSRPAFSPDGGKIAYVVSSANFDKNGYDSALWLYDLASDSGRQLTFTNSEKFFAWSRDGRELLFTSGRGDLPKDSTRFYALPLDGGEARELFTIDRPASAIADLGGGRWLVTATFEPVYDNPEGADYYVIEQLPFTANGKGFVCQRRTGLAVYDAASGGFTRVTPEHMEVARCHLSDDGRKALLVAVEYTDVKPTTNHVYELDLSTGALACLSEGLSFGFKDAGWYKDGALVTGSDQKTVGVNQNIQFFFLRDKKLTAVTPNLDSSLRNAVGSDCRYNTAEQEGGFAVDGGRVISCATEGFRSRLYALEADGSIFALTKEIDTVDNWDWKDGKAVMAGFKGLQLQELYLLENGRERQLTRHNEDVIKELQLSAPEHVSCENEGWQLDGWYMKPVDYEEGRKYPTILHIHGGPKSAFGGVYFHEMQAMADQELQKYACIIVDEAQFLTKEEVYYLVHLVDDCNIPVICYGLRADFKGDLFPGSYHLLVLADKLEEVKTICWCGKKAAFNARFDDQGHVLKEGEQVVLGANDQYIGLCRRHWMAGDLGPDFHRLRK